MAGAGRNCDRTAVGAQLGGAFSADHRRSWAAVGAVASAAQPAGGQSVLYGLDHWHRCAAGPG
ncbi:MAG: hypothetical protein EA368_01540 [Leptolyngbya sp. DLM2.Bin27]|nr:MAG: hypothetical protein EA368_01540 [Leptolyngbya sp. DLM2.Bin27]